MSIAEEVEKLNNLRQSGALTEDEYQKAKESVLAMNRSATEKVSKAVSDISTDVNMWSMFIHLSQFCGYVIPLAGLIVPIVLWQIKKSDSEIIDKHGKIVVNWILTGIPLILALAVLSIVFPIIGGIRANAGEIWPYPLSIKFFRLD